MAGAGGTQARGREPLNFAEFVRQAMHSAVDQVEPCADGLVSIRARILAGSGVPWPQALALSLYWLDPKRKS